MRPVGKKWRRPALVLTSVGLVVVVGCFAASSQTVRAMFAGGALASTTPGSAANSTETGHGHAHGGDAPSVKTTLWASKVDIFLERPYAVAGKAIEPLFHVTVIKNGSPVTEGSLTFQATGPEQSTVEIRLDQPTGGNLHPLCDIPEGRRLRGQDHGRESAGRGRRRDDGTAAGGRLWQS